MKGILTAVAMMAASALSAQVYKTSTGVIKFFSHTTMEDIDATNSQVAAAMDAASGAVEISLSVNAFQFKKALMQKHFQENYMETGKFPKS
ncbi:MAG: YceI family protein, partial [Bacteroidetes bacterium]|nr:YceI family protein [Bacteroidota bacterium]